MCTACRKHVGSRHSVLFDADAGDTAISGTNLVFLPKAMFKNFRDRDVISPSVSGLHDALAWVGAPRPEKSICMGGIYGESSGKIRYEIEERTQKRVDAVISLKWGDSYVSTIQLTYKPAIC